MKCLTKNDDAVCSQPSERIGNGRLTKHPAKKGACEATYEPRPTGQIIRPGVDRAGHDICSALQNLHQTNDVFGILREVTLKHDRAVAFRVRSLLHDPPEELLHGSAVAELFI